MKRTIIICSALITAAIALASFMVPGIANAGQAAKPAPPTLTTTNVSVDMGTLAPGATGYARADCPAGTVITGGGFALGNDGGGLLVTSSAPAGNGWAVTIVNNGTTDRGAFVDAECGSVG